MGLDLWFRQDVARILASTWYTMHACTSAGAAAGGTRPPGAEGTRVDGVASSEERMARAYRRGFEDALRAVGVAFGLAEGGNGGRPGGTLPSVGYPPDSVAGWGED